VRRRRQNAKLVEAETQGFRFHAPKKCRQKGTVPFLPTTADHLSMVPGRCPQKSGQSPKKRRVKMWKSTMLAVLAAQDLVGK
jgi:hypothetical protein